MTGRRPQRDQPLDDFLRDAADDAIVTGVKGHPRPDHRGRRGAAEKAVTLDEQRARAGARRSQRRGTARVSAADDENVVIRHAWDFAGRGGSTAERRPRVQ